MKGAIIIHDIRIKDGITSLAKSLLNYGFDVYQYESTFTNHHNIFSLFREYEIKKFEKLNILQKALFLNKKVIDMREYDIILIPSWGLPEFLKIKGNVIFYFLTYPKIVSREYFKFFKSFWIKNFEILLEYRRFYNNWVKKKIIKEKHLVVSNLSYRRLKLNGINLNKRILFPCLYFDKRNLKNCWKNKKEIDDDTIVYVSRFFPTKRQLFLVKNLPNDKKLFLVGSITSQKYFIKVKRYAEKNRNIRILVNISGKKKYEIISKAKIGVFIPYLEDFGLVPIEYLFCRTPFLISSPSGVLEILSNIKNKETPFKIISETKLKHLKNYLISSFSENMKVNRSYLKKLEKKISPKRFIKNLKRFYYEE